MRIFACVMERLVLFDIDGTLVRTQNGHVPFNEAILQSFGIAGDIRTVVPDGNTDPQIVEEIFAAAKVDISIADEHWERFATNLRLSYANAVRKGTMTVRALPGVLELLRALSANKRFGQGVVTGNFAVTARVKLETAGLSSYLRLGAYGSDSPHRPAFRVSPKKDGSRRRENLFVRSIASSSATRRKISTRRARIK